jgi:hypothetical protein
MEYPLIDAKHLDEIYSAVADKARIRDKYDASIGVEVRPTIQRIIVDRVLAWMAGAVLAFYISVGIDRIFRGWELPVISVSVLTLLGLLATRRLKKKLSTRPSILAALWGWNSSCLALATLYLGILVRYFAS